MALRNAVPLQWEPKGASDTFDATNAFKGAMSRLTNLVFDQSTEGCFVPRPASTQLTSFAGFTTPGFISCLYVLGTVAYGMIASAKNAGKDEPFAYDLVGAAFITITGVTGANSPTSPATSGEWTPPTMDLIGTKIIVAHAGFPGTASHFFGVIDITTPAAPTWDAVNTATNALPGVPTWVKNFNGRAYFGIGNKLYFSDVLVPTTITNAAQFLTVGDTTSIVAFTGLPLNTSSGGVVQALAVFKNTIIFQVTGDYSSTVNPLTLSALPVGVGTYAPLSLCNTPQGVYFVAPDGVRLLNTLGAVSSPIGEGGEGITIPFINALYKSRVCAAFNSDTVRISTKNTAASNSPYQEWWYDVGRKRWTGPHTFPASVIAPYQSTFVMAPAGVNAKLFQSDVEPNSNSTYTENGTALTFEFTTSLLPESGKMSECCLIETTVGVASLASNGYISVGALNENLQVIDQVSIQLQSTPTFWDNFKWDAGIWDGTIFNLAQIQVPWTTPVTFQQLYIDITGSSFTGFKISNIFMRYQILGYLLQ